VTHYQLPLFNVVLHREIQGIQIQGAMVNGMTQLFGCADDIALMSYSTEVDELQY